jgi:preprotein translocase subunit SecB
MFYQSQEVPMLEAPLRLDASFIERVRVETILGPSSEVSKGDAAVTTQVAMASGQKDALKWKVELIVEVRPKEGVLPPPYEIDLKIIGLFTVVAPGATQDETARMIAVNGASMLYSSTREYLLLLTSRAPAGPFLLPTVSFVDLQPSAPSVPQEPKKASTRKTESKKQPARARAIKDRP